MGDPLHDPAAHRDGGTPGSAGQGGTVLQLPRKARPAASWDPTSTLEQVRLAAVWLVAEQSDWAPDRVRADVGRMFLSILDGGTVPASALPAAHDTAARFGCALPGCIDHYPARPAGCICPAWSDSCGHHLARRDMFCPAHEG
jgi:hypothetical protein